MLRGLFIILLVSPVVTALPVRAEEPSGSAPAGAGTGAYVFVTDSVTAPSAGHTADSTAGKTASPLLTRPLLAAISLYQKVISPQQGEVCAFQPSCSHFARQALRTHGLIQGGLMTSDRLQRCHSCAGGHYRLTGTYRARDPIGDHVLWGKPCADHIHPAQTGSASPAEPGKPHPPRRSPLLAAALSSAIPGAGKVYAGRPADGLYSLLVTGSSALVAVSYGRDEKWTRAGLFGAAGLFLYLGNIYGSAVEARYYGRAGEEGDDLFKGPPVLPADPRARLRLGRSHLSDGRVARGELILRDLLRHSQAQGAREIETATRYWLGVGSLRQGHWVEAAGWFRAVSPGHPESEGSPGAGGLEEAARDLAGGDPTLAARQLEQAALQGYRLDRRSPGLARTMSLFLPGSGQAYAGRPWNGLISLVFNAAAGYLTIDAFGDDRRLDGTLLLGLIWSRFYLGGLHNAGRYAEEYNRKRIEEHLRPYRPLLEPDDID